MKDQEEIETFEKPSRAVRERGRKKKQHGADAHGPKEPYKRERLNRNDFLAALDDEDY